LILASCGLSAAMHIIQNQGSNLPMFHKARDKFQKPIFDSPAENYITFRKIAVIEKRNERKSKFQNSGRNSARERLIVKGLFRSKKFTFTLS
jgi:hypothetical protein